MSDGLSIFFILSVVTIILLLSSFASPNSLKQIVFILFMINSLAIVSIVVYLLNKD